VKIPTSIKDRVEIVTNILIAVVILMIGTTYLKSHTGHHEASLSPGEQINAPHGYKWRNHDQTLVVAVRKGCVYCERSYSLYRRLDGLEHSNTLKAHMVIVMPDDPASGAELLRSQQITSQSIPDTPLGDVKVSGTPTLLLVDANGRLLQSWVGELDSSKAEALVAQLRR
jgi:thioredoxin-related protein